MKIKKETLVGWLVSIFCFTVAVLLFSFATGFADILKIFAVVFGWVFLGAAMVAVFGISLD